MTVLTRKDIEKTGHNSVADVLRDTTASSFGGARESSGSNAAGNAEVSLRGLGSANTLVLLNGQRLPSDAVTGAVDLNMIPMAAVERIEVLKDGASALYGSDALGGVVNIITRKDFSGTQLSATGTAPFEDGGIKTEVSGVNGLNFEKLNVVNVIQYRNNKTVYSRDRSWSNRNMSRTGNPGSYRNSGGKWKADPNCPADKIESTPAGDFCTFNTADFSTMLPALQQIGALTEANYEASSSVKLIARASGTQKKVQWSYAPAPGTFTIPGAVANTLGAGGGPLPGVTPGQDLNVMYRLAELGNRDTEITTYGYNLLAGAKIQLPADWQLDTTLAHNGVHTTDRGVNGYALTNELTSLITSGAYNPFGAAGQKGSLDRARYIPEEKTMSLLTSAEVKGSGEVATFDAGPLALAVGGVVTHQKYEDIFDEKSVNNQVFGNAGSSGGGLRNTQALFAELSVPVIKDLELQLAGRYDHYSDFGSTTNPKAALLYRPMPSLLFRGSVGTGFRAPLMQELYAATGNGYPTFIDQVACNAEIKAGGKTPSCLPQQYQVTSSGNKGLKEQTSLSYNLGAVFEPSRNFNVGADWFLTSLSNVVGIDYTDAMKAAASGVNLAGYGVIVRRDADGYIESIEAPLQNLSSQKVSGLDITASYRLGDFKLSTDHALLFYFKEEGFPGTGLVDKLGDNGRPPWRNTTTLSYSPTERHEVSLTGLTIAGQKMTVKEQGNLSAYTAFHLAYSYKSQNWGTFSLGIRNLFNTTPPLDESMPTEKLNTNLYDQLGPQVIAGYKVNI